MSVDAKEFWIPIPDFPNYQLSNLGRVMSRPRERTRGGILSPWNNGKGYLQVTLLKDTIPYIFAIAPLVAKYFCGTKQEGEVCNHKDGDPYHNHDHNLEWVSWGVDHNHAYQVLRHGHMKLTLDLVQSIHALRTEGLIQRAIGRRLGLSKALVGNVLRGELPEFLWPEIERGV